MDKAKAKEATEAIRESLRKIYYGGLKGEDVLPVINEGYIKTFELDGFIDQTTQPAPAQPTTDTTQTTGA